MGPKRGRQAPSLRKGIGYASNPLGPSRKFLVGLHYVYVVASVFLYLLSFVIIGHRGSVARCSCTSANSAYASSDCGCERGRQRLSAKAVWHGVHAG